MVTGAVRRVGGPLGLFLLVLAMVLAPLGLLSPASAAPGDPGTVAGTVYDADFTEVSGATVTLYDSSKAAIGTPRTTGADGTYEFGGLSGSTYYVGATKSGVGTVFYDSAGSLSNAQALDPEFGAYADLYLIPPPVIAGTVSNASGPLAGADVTAYELDGSWTEVAYATTDASGHYEIAGLPPKAYRLQFSALDHITEYWNDKASLSTANDVTVAVGAVQQANAVLTARTAVSGRVTGTGGTGVANASVTAEQQVTDQFGDTYWDQVDFATTAGDGTYTLRVPPGATRIQFEATGYLSEYYNDALDVADADLVQVAQAPVPNINAALVVGGTIKGLVRNASNVGIPSVSVTAYRNVGGTWQAAGSGYTDGTGSYTVDGLRTGTYRVQFSTFGAGGYLSEYYQDKDTLETANDVGVTQGGTVTANATLDVGGQVTGTVTGPSGAVAGAEVVLYSPSRFSQSGWSWRGSQTTVAGGTYTFTGLVPGAYRVCVESAAGLAPECWNDKPDVYAADSVMAAKNTTVTASFVLAAARKISGAVTSRAGGALTGPSVSVDRKVGGPEGTYWESVAHATPGAGGAYSVDVAPGTYRVAASADEHRYGFYSEPSNPTRPARIVVAAGADQTGKNVALDRYGRIAGTVNGPSGALSGATVRVYRWSNPSFVQVGSVQTAAGGAYTVTGLNPGNYRVGFSATGMTPEFLADKADVELADDVAVALNGTAGASATLASSQRTLSGTVTAAVGGAALADVDVQVERRVQTQDDVRWRLVDEVSTIANGTWSTTVPDGTYRVRFARTDYLVQWFSGATSAANASLVVVNGANRTGLNAALQLGATISGTVSGPGGAIQDGYVTIYRQVAPGSFEDVDYASTSATGAYRVSGLVPGTYAVELAADGHVTEYWNDKASLATANPITLAVGGTATANATLAAARKLSGTVTGPSGAALADADVVVERQYDDGDGGTYWDDYTDATTTASGAWTADVRPGTYRVRFQRSGHLTEWWNNATTAAAAQQLVVTTADIGSVNAQLAAAAVLTGHVSGPDGPVSGRVTVYPASATDLATAVPVATDFSDSDGTYRVDTLPAGSYKIRFESSRLLPEFHSDKPDLATANAVALSTGSPTTIDATLARGRAITGTVTGVGGAIDTATVYFHQRQPDGSYDLVDWDSTDADGAYRGYLPAGTYKVSFTAYDNRVSEWWNNVASQEAATPVVLGASDVGGISAVLDDGATVTGTVTFPQRKSGWDDRVVVRDAATGAFAGSASVNAHTNAYTVTNLPPGTYRAEFARDPGYDVAEAQFYDGKAEHLGVGASQAFTLAAAATRTAVSAVLVEGGRLTGRVRDTSSNPVADCIVTAYTSDGSRVDRESRPSGADGTYAIPGLTTGSYLLRVEGGGCGSGTTYYDGVGTVSPSSADAVAVPATRGISTAVPQDVVIGAPDAPPMVNNTLPTISDTTPDVGQTLTATSGTWTPSDGTYAYQWLAAGVPITGATTSAYTPVAGDAGKALAVRVTASRSGRTSASAVSASTSPVSAGTITNSVRPAISDTTPEVGQALTATSGTWNPADGTYAFQWLANGTAITGATTNAYAPVAGDVGKKLSVRVTASRAGWTSGVAISVETSAVSTPGTPVMVNLTLPTISDTTPEVGQALTATSGTWNPADGTYAYQWLADGAPIAGATTNGYTPVDGDVGRMLSVRVTASRGGHTPDSATSAATSAVAAVVTPPPPPPPPPPPVVVAITCPTPKATGTFTVGKKVKAVVGTVSPAGVTVTYQWLRNGKAIKKAKKASYKLTAKDRGKKVSVKVTYSKAGLTTVVKTSKAKKVK